MIRRLLRWAVNGLCLLSLLACLATAWLWWHARPWPLDWVEVSACRVRVTAASIHDGVGLSIVRDWNGPPGFRTRSAAARRDPADRHVVVLLGSRPPREWRWGQWRGRAGTIQICVDPDGRPERLTEAEAAERIRSGAAGGRSPDLPQWSVGDVPHWHVLLATAAGPAAWAAGRGRRAWRGRRRARRGRCAACGYDLRATPDAAGPRLHRCPKCGATAARGAA